MTKQKSELIELYHNGNSFFLYQAKDVFKVTTDSVKLVDFVTIRKDDQVILDIGTGLATIPLLLATKTKKKIIGVEIQESLSNLAKESIKYNHLEEQIEIINDKIQNYKNYFLLHNIDVVVSNPPYFKLEDNPLKNKTDELTIARHEVMLTFDELAQIVSKLLKENGRFFFVHQSERLIEIIETLKKYELEPKKLQFLYHNKEKDSTLFLLEASYKGKRGLKVLGPQMIGEE